MAEPGDRIADRYELVSPLGEGGMGVVWRARDVRLGRAVAVKVLTAASVGSDTARVRLIREARAAAALEHDGITRVYDVGELSDGGAYLVMELVRGKSLRDELEKGPLSPRRCAQIIVQVARALQVAHDAGVVHRDIKPDNIMLRGGDRIMIVDFGVAKPVATDVVTNAETLAGVTNTTLTGAGQIVGTPAYLSPEQARGPDVGAETDQFALAVTAFEAMTGRRPWIAKTVVEVVAAILRDPPASLRELVPLAPAALEAAINRALAKEPKDRHPSMSAFADALEEAISGLTESTPASGNVPSARVGSTSTTPPSHSSAATTTATVSTHHGQVRTPPEPQSRRPGGLALVGVALLLVVGFFVVASRMRGSPGVAPAASAHAEGALAGVVSCPQFDVSGVDAPWLGAAAATLACERIQIARGGWDAATRTPAELAGVPREVTPGTTSGVFDAPGSRDKAIATAGRSRWVDGKVEKQAEVYVVTAVLRGPGGAELARGEGRELEMFEALRSAMMPILRTLPSPTPEERADLREWLDVDSVEDALALLDVRTALLLEDPVSSSTACAALEGRPGLSSRTLYLARSTCRRKLRTGPLAEPPPPLDESTPGALITTSLAQGAAGGPAALRARAHKLEAARDRTAEPEGKARLAAAAAELYNLVADERARDVARSAVRSSTKAVDWRTSAWHRVAFSSTGDAALAAALSTWHPWEPVAQLHWVGSLGSGKSHARSVFNAYLLSRRGPYANSYADVLLERGDIEAARGVAELANDDLLRVSVLLAEAQYGAVLLKVPQLIRELPVSDATAARAFGLAYLGVRASVILERPADFVDLVVTRYVLSEPHHVVDGATPVISLVHACTLAPRPTGRRCIERLEELRRAGKLPTIFSLTEPVLAGAARFVADDYPGAAKSWRTLFRSGAWVQGPLREPLAMAFDLGGESELAEEVEAPIVALVDLPRTADMAWVRAAKRAYKRGDHAQARKLARAVVDKWRFSDEKVPAAQEMKELLAKLPP